MSKDSAITTIGSQIPIVNAVDRVLAASGNGVLVTGTSRVVGGDRAVSGWARPAD